MARSIQFEIDDEIEGHLNALSEDWEKDPVMLAKALFKEELMGQTSGARGVPHSRRYWYRNADVYFTQEEKERREKMKEAFRASLEGLADRKERQQNLDRMTAAIEQRKKESQT